MSYNEVRRHGLSAQLLTQLAGEHGMPAARCLAGTGLVAESLDDPQTEVTVEQELRLIRNLLGELGHVPALGLQAGLRYHLSIYGIWGFALLTSSTYRSAAETVERFLDLSYAIVRVRGDYQPTDFRVVFDVSDIPADLRQFLLERAFAGWLVVTREIQPRSLPILTVQFQFPRPPYAEKFRELCGVEPRFNAAENSISLDPAAVDAPLPQADAVMARMCLEQCRQLLAKRKLRPGVAGLVRDCMFQMSGQIPTIEAIAQQLHMAPRSIRRRLEEEGTSFRALSEEVLQALAEDMLGTTNMKLEEVAMRLGYSEATSFTHAFKRWTGQSPQAYRESQGGA
ncbi:AraC family transcriptional regulator [Solimonas sp. K1W22B-7]|uniref:AraC family transcriptional regulator n=1 Tax=Solimonas sp. K1W22B-7 TaxID=2303331 RepID=UPI0013C47AFA|nr:AraC family transcriptional regulator [Solimonas sp. K1W22B-7]